MCQQRAGAQLVVFYALAVVAVTGAEPSSSHSQSTCHLRRYSLDLVVVVGRAHSRCAQMQVQVVTGEIIVARNLKAQW